LDEPMLERVKRRGRLGPEDAARLGQHAAGAEAIGAGAVLVTCSTISPVVDAVRPLAGSPVPKTDEAMVAEAVRLGAQIGVVATSATTLEPTRRLQEAEGRRQGREVATSSVLVEGAIGALTTGDGDRHDRMVAEAALSLAARCDVVVLAQASMARALSAMPEAVRRAPILSSPDLALRQLRAALAGAPLA